MTTASDPLHVPLTGDELAADLDLQFQAAALAIGMAGALLTGEDATAGMVDLMALWPDEVHDSAAVVGYRVAMILAEAMGQDPEALGTVAAQLIANK